MDFIAIIAIVFLVLITLWWVLRPLWQTDDSQAWSNAGGNQQYLEEFYHRRDAVYTAIKDLELDLAGGKVSQEDYVQLRSRLMSQAAAILRAIDQLAPRSDDFLETEIDDLLRQFQAAETNGHLALREQVRREIRERLVEKEPSPCPHCQNLVEDDDTFCSRCGAPLRRQCPECGAAARPNDAFCAYCGVSLAAETAE